MSLAPGNHTFKFVMVQFGTVIGDAKAVLTLEAGKKYFVGFSNNFPKGDFGQIELQKGREIVAETELAKFIHQPLSLSEFKARVAGSRTATSNSPNNPANDKSKNASMPTNPPGSNATASWGRDILPSSKQVGDFLEGLAAVALIGLVVFGAAKGAAASAPAQYTPPVFYQTQPAISQKSLIMPMQPAMTWRGSNGTLSEILQSKTAVTVQNTSTGTQYRVANGHISGTDGSSFKSTGL